MKITPIQPTFPALPQPREHYVLRKAEERFQDLLMRIKETERGMV